MFKKNSKLKSEIAELLETVVFSFLFVLLLTTIFVKPVRVYGSSMYPTLHDHDTGFSSIISVYLGKINRFDIVVVHMENSNENLVKRVIGLPNETVCYQDDKLYIDNVYYEEPFLNETYKKSQSTNRNFTNDFACVLLGEKEYFVMGDNRPYSSDSRFYGPFQESQLTSKGVLVLWPLSDFGIK